MPAAQSAPRSHLLSFNLFRIFLGSLHISVCQLLLMLRGWQLFASTNERLAAPTVFCLQRRVSNLTKYTKFYYKIDSNWVQTIIYMTKVFQKVKLGCQKGTERVQQISPPSSTQLQKAVLLISHHHLLIIIISSFIPAQVSSS